MTARFCGAAALIILTLSACNNTTEAWKWKNTYTQPLNDFRTGIGLARDCASTDVASNSFCDGYLAGAADMLNSFRELGGYQDCLPQGTTLAQVRQVVVQSTQGPPRPPYRLRPPGADEEHATTDIIGAMNEKWGCGVPYYSFNPDRYKVVPRSRM